MESLGRIMRRLRAEAARNGNPDPEKVTRRDLQRAIMRECGTSPATYFNNARALTDLGWIRRRRKLIYLTGDDITEDF